MNQAAPAYHALHLSYVGRVNRSNDRPVFGIPFCTLPYIYFGLYVC